MMSFTLLVLTTCGLHIFSEAVAILVHLRLSYKVAFFFDEKALLINPSLIHSVLRALPFRFPVVTKKNKSERSPHTHSSFPPPT